MGMACGMHEKEEKLQDFCVTTWQKATVWKV